MSFDVIGPVPRITIGLASNLCCRRTITMVQIIANESATRRIITKPLFDGYAFCEIARLIDVGAAKRRQVVRQQLQRNRRQERLQPVWSARNRNLHVGDASVASSPSVTMAITKPSRAFTS